MLFRAQFAIIDVMFGREPPRTIPCLASVSLILAVACACGPLACNRAAAPATDGGSGAPRHLATVASSAAAPATKRLIEFGWDRPTPDFVRQNIATMEQQPFDGVVVTLHAGTMIFKRNTYPDTAFERDQTDLRATQTSRLKHNFLLVWATSEPDWDWFSDDDWGAAERNLRGFARSAKIGGYKGILFDTEPYEGNTWYYLEQPHSKDRSFEDYQGRLRKRGARFMRVIQEEMPAAVVLMTWGPTTALPRRGAVRDLIARRRFIEREAYGLLPAFIDGALDAIAATVTLVDGHEAAYFIVDKDGFVESLSSARDRPSPDLDPRHTSTYLAQYRFANAVWVDWIMNSTHSPDFFGFYLSSESDRLKLLEHNVYYALSTADEYAWIYSQNMNWWTGDIPAGVSAAIRSAKHKVDDGLPLGFDIGEQVRVARKHYEERSQTHSVPSVNSY